MIAIRFAIYIITAQNPTCSPKFKSLYFITIALYSHHVWLYFITIKLSCDIEENPGPQSKPCSSLSVCHWNLNSIPARNFIKFSLFVLTSQLKKMTLHAFLKLI